MASARNVIAALSVFLGLSGVYAAEGTQDARTLLYKSLFHSYSKEVAPDGIAGGPVIVNHSLSMQRIIGLDDNVLTLQTWSMMKWFDTRLTWNPVEYNGVTELRVPSRNIWQPDIVLLNSADDYGGFSSGDLNGVVTSAGHVTFVPPIISKSYCSVDDYLYEDNVVTCPLEFMSWTYSGQQLDPKLVQNGIDVDYLDAAFNKQWKYVESSAEKEELKFDCCPETYPQLQYKLKLKRIR